MMFSIISIPLVFAGGFLSGIAYARIRAAEEAKARAERENEDDIRVLRKQSEIMNAERSRDDAARDLDSGSF